jgi:hypothetical protein
MPHVDPAAHDAAHLVSEFLAAIVLTAAGLVILGLAVRRRRLGGPAPVSVAAAVDAAASVRSTLLVIATVTAVAGVAIALAPILRADAPETLTLLGASFGGIALGLLGVARFSVPRLEGAPLRTLGTALSVGAVPVVGVAFLAVVVALSAPGAVAH